MASGTKQTGFVTADLGPFQCSNCGKWDEGVCKDKEVAADKSIPDRGKRMLKSGMIRTEASECCNEFESRMGKKNSLGMKLVSLR